MRGDIVVVDSLDVQGVVEVFNPKRVFHASPDKSPWNFELDQASILITEALIVDNNDSMIMAADTASKYFPETDAIDQQLELLRRQYLQLWEPIKLSIPSMDIVRLPGVQASIFESIFKEDNLKFAPPDRYKLRVLKILIDRIERAIVDPEEDVGFPCP